MNFDSPINHECICQSLQFLFHYESKKNFLNLGFVESQIFFSILLCNISSDTNLGTRDSNFYFHLLLYRRLKKVLPFARIVNPEALLTITLNLGTSQLSLPSKNFVYRRKGMSVLTFRSSEKNKKKIFSDFKQEMSAYQEGYMLIPCSDATRKQRFRSGFQWIGCLVFLMDFIASNYWSTR